ncbi:hypothetical protein GCM10007857_26150 [Bradyrhizobium iriomotense]|uniref:Uncharacterized protein n=1 Tax=Bradyrhizobium iriomotense TaxID=441950 RepID=A0ABQ6AUL9_9BRAD|nr:hypothetical protein GCM10007857_26150 [Bradyrhizobium iriomotense]
MRLGDIEQERKQNQSPKGGRHVDPQFPAWRAMLGSQRAFRVTNFVKGVGTTGEVSLAVGRQAEMAGGTIEEFGAEALLKPSNALADGRFGYPELLCGGCEASSASGFYECGNPG